jgi:hypothetical protein
VNAWTLDPRSLFNTTRPRIEAARVRSLTELRALEDDPVKGLPLALTVAASLPVALLVGVPTAGVGIGVLLGLGIAGGATLYWRGRQREAAAALVRTVANIHADADRRVELVTRQYEWAVNDVANLRDALRRSREQLATRHEMDSTPSASLVRRLSDTDPFTTLRFATQGMAPEQVRVLNNGVVVAISARALEAADGAAFTMRMSEYVAEALRGGNAGYRIEALIDENWRTVELRPANDIDLHTTEIRDKRGRAYRIPAQDAPHAILTLPVPQIS